MTEKTMPEVFLQEDALKGSTVFYLALDAGVMAGGAAGGKYVSAEMVEQFKKMGKNFFYRFSLMEAVDYRPFEVALNFRRAMTQEYQKHAPGSPSFLQQDSENFRYSPSEVRSIRLKRLNAVSKMLTKKSDRMGHMKVLLVNGRKRNFWLFGKADMEAVHAMLAGALPGVEIGLD